MSFRVKKRPRGLLYCLRDLEEKGEKTQTSIPGHFDDIKRYRAKTTCVQNRAHSYHRINRGGLVPPAGRSRAGVPICVYCFEKMAPVSRPVPALAELYLFLPVPSNGKNARPGDCRRSHGSLCLTPPKPFDWLVLLLGPSTLRFSSSHSQASISQNLTRALAECVTPAIL